MKVRPVHCRPEAFDELRAVGEGIESNAGLLRGAVALCRHEHPETEVAAVEDAIAALGHRVARRVKSGMPRAILAHAHAVLFDEEGFHGDADDYYAAHNSYLSVVLERKSGLPITLALVYKLVLEHLGLRVFGVGAPGHFLACVQLAEDSTLLIDAFAGGRVLSVEEAVRRVQRFVGPKVPAIPLPVVSHRAWLQRMIRNLAGAFAMENRLDDRAAMEELLTLL